MPRKKKEEQLNIEEEIVEVKKTKKASTKSTTESKKTTKTKKSTAKKPAKKKVEDDDYDYDDDILEADDDELEYSDDEEYYEDPDEITEEELEAVEEIDLDDFEKFVEQEEQKEGNTTHRRIFKTSSRGEEARAHFIEICKKYHSGDPVLVQESKNEAVEELQSFVYYLIQKKYDTYARAGHREDLFQEGVLGIMTGLEKYDPKKSPPTTFFNLYIVHEMSKFVDTQVNKTTPHYSTSINKIKKVQERFEAQNKKATVQDIVVETNLTTETVIQCLNIIQRTNEKRYDSEEALDAQITERGISPEQEYIQDERLRTLYACINELSLEEREVLKYKFGLLGAQKLSFKDIAKEMGVSIEKVRKYKNDALKKLSHKPKMRYAFRDYVEESQNNQIPEKDIPTLGQDEDMLNSKYDDLSEIPLDVLDNLFGSDDEE